MVISSSALTSPGSSVVPAGKPFCWSTHVRICSFTSSVSVPAPSRGIVSRILVKRLPSVS